MKPTRLQYFFAQKWPINIWLFGIPLLFAYGMWLSLEPLSHWMDLLRVIYYIVIALLLGFFMALLCGWFILSPIYYDRGLKNGAPFREGDMVRILVGPHRDRIVKVYAMWQGNTVRVELGDKEKREFKDIFSPAQLLREENAEQDA